MSNLSAFVLAAMFLGAAGARPLPAQSPASAPPGSFVPVDGSRLYYQECGTGAEAVVLIHDGVVHSAVWDDVWPAFCRRFHTIRYDRRGYGQSPASTTWHSETDDLSAVLQRVGK